MAVLSVEYNSLPENVARQLKNNSEFIVDWLTKILKMGKKTKKFNFSDSSTKKAYFLFYSLEGIVLMNRTTSTEKLFWNSVDQLKKSLEIKMQPSSPQVYRSEFLRARRTAEVFSTLDIKNSY